MCEACNEQPNPPPEEEKNGEEEGETEPESRVGQRTRSHPMIKQKEKMRVRKLFIHLRIQLHVFHVDPRIEAEDGQCTFKPCHQRRHIRGVRPFVGSA